MPEPTITQHYPTLAEELDLISTLSVGQTFTALVTGVKAGERIFRAATFTASCDQEVEFGWGGSVSPSQCRVFVDMPSTVGTVQSVPQLVVKGSIKLVTA